MRIAVLTVLLGFTAAPGFSGVADGIAFLDDGDVASAATEFAAAYEAGEPEGAFYLGRLFELGLGTEQDEMRAANLYSAAVDAGSVRAQVRLGLMYHEGRVLLRDYAEGTRLLCAAADAGDADGQLNCGLAYQIGRGVAENTEQAVTYWQMSADQGNILAMNVLGQYQLDLGDVDAAKAHFLQAADLGNAGGMFEYAKLLADTDIVTAYAYANLAVVRGLNDAALWRDRIEAEMTVEDIAAGQAKARTWTEERIRAEAE
ncbi:MULTISPECIES: tetratricopeptide repeat protein [unclassified Yoonia]|uniref:tetratricopeptide repeat protein n=1 Tax=unclassified Yoonia TaxID=2629118 RepID=UPI002AFFE0B1|nr:MULTISPECIES: tetratricopeptide repeat protein [unclassified Yoonia]